MAGYVILDSMSHLAIKLVCGRHTLKMNRLHKRLQYFVPGMEHDYGRTISKGLFNSMKHQHLIVHQFHWIVMPTFLVMAVKWQWLDLDEHKKPHCVHLPLYKKLALNAFPTENVKQQQTLLSTCRIKAKLMSSMVFVISPRSQYDTWWMCLGFGWCCNCKRRNCGWRCIGSSWIKWSHLCADPVFPGTYSTRVWVDITVLEVQ